MTSPSSSDRDGIGLSDVLVLGFIFTVFGGAILMGLMANTSPATETASTKTDITLSSDTAESPDPPRRGSIAPDFALTDPEGNSHKLIDWHGRPMLINFWATWCGPCEVEMPAMQAAYEAHKENGLVVLAVAVDDNVKNVVQFFDRHDLTFQPLMDDGTVSSAYYVFGLPTSFFVGAKGKITDVHTGMLTESKIREYLARALGQE